MVHGSPIQIRGSRFHGTLLLVLFSLLNTANPVLLAQSNSRSVTLAWDATTDPTATGNLLYYWALPDGPTNVVAVSGTTHDLDGLTEGLTYGFFLTATNAQGLESEPSNTVHFTPLTAIEDTPLPNLLTDISSPSTDSILITSTENGSVTPDTNSPPLTFTPTPNFAGKATFTYTLTQTSADPIQGWVSILVAEGNDDPPQIPTELTQSIQSGQPFDLTIPVTDPDTPPDLFSFQIYDSPWYGSLIETTYRTNGTFHLLYTDESGPAHPGEDAFVIVTTLNTDPPQDFFTTVTLTLPTTTPDPLTVTIDWTRTTTLPAPALLMANITDPLGNPVTNATLNWSLNEGPAPVTFTDFATTGTRIDLTTPGTRIDFATPGTYTVSLTAQTATAIGSATHTITVNELAPTTPFSLLLEAEQATLTGNANPTLETTPNHETVQYVSTTSPDDSLTFTFSLPREDHYIVWCRVKTTAPNKDSFITTLDDQPSDIFDCSSEIYGDEYHWVPLCGRSSSANGWDQAYANNAQPLLLTAGEHTLRFSHREADARLDSLLIVNESAVNPLTATTSPTPHTRLLPDPQGLKLAFNAIQGLRYEIQHTPSLNNTWSPLTSATAEANNEVLLNQPLPYGFFRVRILE
jgi:hypothetical protein